MATCVVYWDKQIYKLTLCHLIVRKFQGNLRQRSFNVSNLAEKIPYNNSLMKIFTKSNHESFKYSMVDKCGIEPKNHLFDSRALQEYLLICCQNLHGGLLDKPGRHRDFFHTCYTLSGLSVAQHFLEKLYILGPERNQIAPTHPIYNIRPDLVRKAVLHFNNLGLPENKLTSTT